MVMKWDDKANAKLLKSIITRAKLTKKDYQAIAEDMGDGCTATAVYFHVYGMTKLKKDGEKTPDGSPKKRCTQKSPGKTPTNTASASKKRKTRDSAKSEEDNCKSTAETPTKKRIKAEKGVAVKNEDGDDFPEIA